MSGKMKLGVFPLDVGHHIAAWRHPDVPPGGATDLSYFRHLAQVAERGKLDMIFFGDQMAAQYPDDESIGRTSRVLRPEPIALLSALAAVTERIGLVATVSTSYFEPYHVARKFSTLDHFSNGRAGWNIVTSWNDKEALNFNRGELLEHGLRYRRALEFVDVTTRLWDSWEDDAFLHDKDSGRFFDPEKLHVSNFKGEYFSARGPLNLPRSPQGYPVLVQAGSSDDGRDFAAKTAEVIFTAQPDLTQAKAFYADIKAQVEAAGRSPNHVKVMPGLMPIVGRSEAEAQEKFQRLQDLIDPQIGWVVLSRHLGGVDLSAYPLDGPVPELPLTQGNQSRQRLLLDMARRDGLTLRQLYERVVGSRGHWIVAGTAEQIADQMESWLREGGADGFNLMPPWLPGNLEEFVDHVIPVLQRRGLFRTEYEGRTLRDNLGLPKPTNRFKDGRKNIWI
ncbi:LLM class flavin-dependent oxidoreductase [Uliginosibacterium sp. H3]|uniref:LLM class flavin-dependent oxidoreductase n=1 Tax=Uliginosibacterium silvisoli TaxID=3114758 RepID=A0ABU6K4U0_9RHOO|nr:LLM class flavin-dependent oxidoreductase [Uliginosibacterium sp. H3]